MKHTVEAYNKYVGIGKRALVLTRQSSNAAIKSADAATLSANTAKRALELTERADVLVEKAASSDAPLITASALITLTLKNFGRTRAKHVVMDGALSIVKDRDAREIVPISALIPVVIGPADTYTVVLNPARDFLSGPDMVNLNDGGATLCFELRIKYEDPFGPHAIDATGIYSHGTFTIAHTDTD